jgi:hypothetical protein
MKSFGHQRHEHDDAGNVVRLLDSPARARTVNPLGRGYGPDSDKRLVVTLAGCDVIVIRPERTRRGVSILARDLYAELLRRQARSEAAVKANRTRKRLAKEAE